MRLFAQPQFRGLVISRTDKRVFDERYMDTRYKVSLVEEGYTIPVESIPKERANHFKVILDEMIHSKKKYSFSLLVQSFFKERALFKEIMKPLKKDEILLKGEGYLPIKYQHPSVGELTDVMVTLRENENLLSIEDKMPAATIGDILGESKLVLTSNHLMIGRKILHHSYRKKLDPLNITIKGPNDISMTMGVLSHVGVQKRKEDDKYKEKERKYFQDLIDRGQLAQKKGDKSA